VEVIQNACSSVNRYPDPKARGITKVLAERLAFPVGQIVVTNGSDQGISVSLLKSLEKVPYSTTQSGGHFMQMSLFLTWH
jgi:histidinol-phosphate/aromatic aminotransferase/cobyric acid decarboxylase-like protein